MILQSLIKYVTVFFSSRQDYVSKCVDYIFNTSVKTIYKEFYRGFYTVCNLDIIRQFQPEELKTAITGNDNCDWKQFENVSENLKVPSNFSKLFINMLPKTFSLSLFSLVLKNSLYEREYHKSHPTILLFWKAFHKLTLDEKKKFLRKYCNFLKF